MMNEKYELMNKQIMAEVKKMFKDAVEYPDITGRNIGLCVMKHFKLDKIEGFACGHMDEVYSLNPDNITGFFAWDSEEIGWRLPGADEPEHVWCDWFLNDIKSVDITTSYPYMLV